MRPKTISLLFLLVFSLPVIAGVIADADAPEAVRLRALARASRALRAMPSTEPRFLVVA